MLVYKVCLLHPQHISESNKKLTFQFMMALLISKEGLRPLTHLIGTFRNKVLSYLIINQ